MSKVDKRRVLSDAAMTALIIYDTVFFAAKAEAMLQQAGRRPGVRVQWDIKPWRIDALEEAAAAEEALVEAADAHLIVLAGQPAQSLPFWLRDWLERWILVRRVPDSALAVIGEGDYAGIKRPVTPALSGLVRQHSLNFIIDEGPIAKDATKLFAHFSREEEFPLEVQPYWVDPVPRVSYRGWGINE